MNSGESPEYRLGSENSVVGPSSRTERLYRLPGDKNLNERDFERYRETNAKLNRAIPSLVREGLLNPSMDVQFRAVEEISSVPEKDREALWPLAEEAVRQAMMYGEEGVRESAVRHVLNLHEEARASLLRCALLDEDVWVRLISVEQIRHVPEKDRAPLWPLAEEAVRQGMVKDIHSYSYRVAILNIPNLSVESRAKLVRFGLAQGGLRNRLETIKYVQHVPEGDRASLWPLAEEAVRQGVAEKDAGINFTAIDQVSLFPDADRTSLLPLVQNLIRRFIKDGASHERFEALKRIKYLPLEEQVESLKLGLSDEDTYFSSCLIDQIHLLSESRRPELWPLAVNVIRKDLGKENTHIRCSAMENVGNLPVKDRIDLIEIGLRDHDGLVRGYAREQFFGLPQEYRTHLRLTTVAPDQLQALAAVTPLYKNQPDPFFQEKFEKTGTGTTLLDAVPGLPDVSLRGRAIVRHIPMGAYVNWRRAYEAADVWKSLGFDYIPIEPIVGVRLSATESMWVDVSARVLNGPSIASWKEGTSLYWEEINVLKRRIQKGLDALGISHGHPHERNFIVMFERLENGEPDLSKPPRVYMIDFDEAVSPGR